MINIPPVIRGGNYQLLALLRTLHPSHVALVTVTMASHLILTTVHMIDATIRPATLKETGPFYKTCLNARFNIQATPSIISERQ